MTTFTRAYTKGTFKDCCCQCPHPCGMPLPTHIYTGDPPTLVGSFGSVSYGVTAPFLWVLVHARFCCALQGWSLFPPRLWKSCNQILWAFRFSPLARSPGCEAWDGIQDLHNSGRSSLALLFSSLWVIHPAGIGFDFIMIAPFLSSGCGFVFVFGCGISFFAGFQHSPVDGCSIASCDFGDPARDECISFYSAILNQKKLGFIFCFITLLFSH